MKDHSILIYQDRYATSIVDKYLYTATVKKSTKFYKTISPSNMILNKADASTRDEQVEKLTREFSINYRFLLGH